MSRHPKEGSSVRSGVGLTKGLQDSLRLGPGKEQQQQADSKHKKGNPAGVLQEVCTVGRWCLCPCPIHFVILWRIADPAAPQEPTTGRRTGVHQVESVMGTHTHWTQKGWNIHGVKLGSESSFWPLEHRQPPTGRRGGSVGSRRGDGRGRRGHRMAPSFA